MALDSENHSEKTGATPPPEEGMTQKRRWLVFGSNVVVAVVLATALAVGAVWLAGALLRGRARSDWTASGRFSISPRTKALLKELPYDIRLTNLYTHAPEIPASEEQWRRVRDLLSEYAVGSPHVTVEAVNPALDVGGVEALVGRLRQRYAEELEKPKTLLETFEKLRSDLNKVLTGEADRLDAVAEAWKGAPPQAADTLRTVAQRWRQLKMVGDFTAGTIQALTDQPLPAYSNAVTRATDFLSQVGENFRAAQDVYKQVTDLAKDAPVPDAAAAVLSAADQTYGPLVQRIEDLKKQGDDLPELQLDKVRSDISEGEVILIETPDQVHVVSFDDVWVHNPAAGEPERRFNGETAVSSALWGLLHKDKPLVLFVTFGGPATLWGGPYTELAERLKRANFIVEDWDLMRPGPMPLPDHVKDLPQDQKRKMVTLVLVPPAPPNPQRPAPPPTAEAYAPVLEDIEAGFPAIVLTEPPMRFGPTVPYRDVFATFGVEARFDAVAVHKVVVDRRGTEKAVPEFPINAYPKHTITGPLGALPSYYYSAVPLVLRDTMPEGVTAEAIVTLPVGQDYWADTTALQAMRGEAERDEASDLVSTAEKPVPLALAVTRKLPADEGIQKAVLFGDAHFAQNDLAFYRDLSGREMFPGNAELFLNSLLWVSGTEHLITVSPEVLQARRIGELGWWALPIQILILAGLPVGVGIAGLAVFIIRRR